MRENMTAAKASYAPEHRISLEWTAPSDSRRGRLGQLRSHWLLSVILLGCADDLVVPDPGCEHAGGSVRGDRLVHAIAAAFAGCACGARTCERSRGRASIRKRGTLMSRVES